MRRYFIAPGIVIAAAAVAGMAERALAQNYVSLTRPAAPNAAIEAGRALVEPLPAEVIPPPVVSTKRGVSLEELTQLAEANNPILREAAAAVAEARWQAMQAGLPPNPRLDSGNPQTIGGGAGVYTTGLTQEIYRGGKLRLDRAAASQTTNRLQMEFVRRRFELLTAVRQGFFEVLAAEQRVRLRRQLLAIAQRSETTSQNLLNAGQVSNTDLLLLRVERRRAEADLRAEEAMWLAARRKLAAQIGIPFYDIDAVAGSLSIPLPDYEDSEVVQEVMATNAQVRGAQFEVNRSQTMLRRAEAQVIPNVTLQGGTQYSVDSAQWQGIAGIYFEIPILNRNPGGIRAANANVSQSVAQVDVVRNELTRQVADAIGRYRATRQQVAIYEGGILPDARGALELVQQGYEGGQFDISRLLQTQRSLFEANLDYINAQEGRLKAAADMAGLLQVEQFP